MTRIPMSLKLVESDTQIYKKILSALLPEVSTLFNNSANKLNDQIPNILLNNITRQPEYNALINDPNLRGQLGLVDPQARLSDIISAITNNKAVSLNSPKISGNKIVANFSIKMVKSNFADLLSLGSASFISEGGYNIPWLKWLLLEGDSIIIADYYFQSRFGTGRTGFGTMRKGGAWRIPPEYAGNISDNWITRAIDASVSEIDSIISKLFP